MASLASINIKFTADLKQFSSQMENVNRSLSKTGKSLQQTGANLTKGLTLPLLGFGAVAVAKFAEFEQEMAKVNAISGATSTQFQALTDNAKKLGETTRYTATEVANLQLNYSKLGFNPEQILAATEATLQLSLAAGEDLANSATVAASTLRGFGLEAEETQRVVDVMALSFSSSALNLEKFETAMAVLAPVAKTAGVSIEEATGLLSILVNAGVDASTAGTGLRNVFLDIADKGLTMDEALGQIQQSTNKNKTAMELFGKRGATVANILADNITEAREFAKAYNAAGGSAERMAKIMDNTLQGAFFKVKSAFEGAAISIGEQMAPVISKVAGYLTDLLGKFNELSPTTKKWIVILGGVAAAIGPLLALAGTILPAIGTGLTLLTGPIGLLIAGLTTIGVIIYKNWKPIKQTLIDIANYFVDLYNESMVFRIGVESIIGVFKTFFEVGKFAFEALKSLLSAFVDNFTNGFKTIGKLIKAVFTGNLDEIPGIIKEAGDRGVDNFKNFTENIGNDWDGLMAGMKDVANETLDNITTRKKLKYFGENVDASAITDKVAEATEQGLINGTVNAGSITSGKIDPNALTLDDEEALSVDPLEGLEQLIIDGGERIRDAVNEAGFNSMISDAVATDLESLNEKTDEAVTAYEERLKALETIGRATGDAVGGAFTSLSGNIVESMKLADHGLQGFVKSLIQGVTKIIATLLSQSIASAIAGGSSAGAATGPGAVAAIPAFIASLVATVIGAFASIPKFETGGVVAGSSFYGDKILARVNSGELILNQRQQKAVFSAMNAPTSNVNISGEWKLRGEDLITVIDRSTKSQNRRS